MKNLFSRMILIVVTFLIYFGGDIREGFKDEKALEMVKNIDKYDCTSLEKEKSDMCK